MKRYPHRKPGIYTRVLGDEISPGIPVHLLAVLITAKMLLGAFDGITTRPHFFPDKSQVHWACATNSEDVCVYPEPDVAAIAPIVGPIPIPIAPIAGPIGPIPIAPAAAAGIPIPFLGKIRGRLNKKDFSFQKSQITFLYIL